MYQLVIRVWTPLSTNVNAFFSPGCHMAESISRNRLHSCIRPLEVVVVPPGHERIRTARTYRHVELLSSRITIGLSGGTVNRVYRQAINLRSVVDIR